MSECKCLRIADRLWESVQVELHGQHSVPRLRALHKYCGQTSLLRAVAILCLTPLPCLAIVVTIDALPLVSPHEGLASQTDGLWFRSCFANWLLTFATISVAGEIVPVLTISARRQWLISLVIGALMGPFNYALGKSIGFPIPFTIHIGTSVWLALLVPALRVSWRNVLRRNGEARDTLTRYRTVLRAPIFLIVVYTVYSVVFTRLSATHQIILSGLLPIVKAFFKNWVSRGVLHLEDLAPCIIVFNVDGFHALYVSLTMQQSMSVGSLVVIMAVDFVQSVAALFEIRKVSIRIYELASRLHNQGPASPTGGLDVDVVGLAVTLVDDNEWLREHPSIGTARHFRAYHRPSVTHRQGIRVLVATAKIQPTDASVVPTELEIVPGAAGAKSSVHARNALDERQQMQLEYVQKVLKLLHMTEFYVQIEFVEVMMASLYAGYLFAISHQPNRVYYTQLGRLSDDQMREDAGRVLLYAELELVSYVVFCLALNRQIKHFSPTRQLAFVLETQWRLIQAIFVVWMFLTVQFSLEHFGTDYTFQFKWLYHTNH